MADRMMPWDEEAEIAVLGAILMDAAVVPIAIESLDESAFYSERHRLIFRCVQQLFDRGETVDSITLHAELQNSGKLEKAGGREYISEILDAVATAANVSYHIGIVKDRALRRRVIHAGTHIVQLGYELDGKSGQEVLDAASRTVYEAAAKDTGAMYSVKQAMRPAFVQIEDFQQSEGGISGVATGLYDLDDMTGGWQKGNLIVIAARPSMGKTAFTVGCALHAALERRVPTAIFSLEMTKEELVQRMLCHEALVDLGALRNGKLRDDDFVRLANAANPLNTARIWIDDSGSLTVMQLRAKARRLKAEQPDLGLVIVDYLQLMTADGENRTQEVSQISRGLKSIAKELCLPVIALSQLSRAPENRAGNRPNLSDLRESGAIEQDADLVGFLFRPEYYQGPRDKEGKDLKGKAELIIAKQRNGPTGAIEMYFRDFCARFESLEKPRYVA